MRGGERMKRFLIGAAASSIIYASMIVPAFAHTTPDQAADTPLGGQSQSQDGAVDGFGGALSNGEAENSLLRNPTCGAHNGPDGIHPAGNP
jgi:hypothetical protein